MEEPEVCLQAFRTDGTLADLKINFRVVVDVVNTHLITDCKASQSDVVAVCSLVPAGRDECISL
jgi:hypothetical protein